MIRRPLLILALCATAAVAADEVILQSPLSTVVRFAQPLPPGDKTIIATVEVPADAPADLGVGAFVGDRHGGWFQQSRLGRLEPGRHELRFVMAEGEPLLSGPQIQAWSASEASLATKAGLFFWSAAASRAHLTIAAMKIVTADGEVAWHGVAGAPVAAKPAIRSEVPADAKSKDAPAAPADAKAVAAAPATAAPVADIAKAVAAEPPVREPQGLYDLHLDGLDSAVTGERWSLSCMPDPFPANPYDPAEFALDAVFTDGDGVERRIPGFFAQPMQSRDRGDSEALEPAGAGTFQVRFRPEKPGTYRLRLEARWRGAAAWIKELTPLLVTGAPWSGYARVDADDPRFFSVNGKFFWPLGPNIRSVNDTRGHERLGSKLTTDRGTISYHAYFDRVAAAGVTAIEIWMSAWNLALEWRGDWPGYFGKGRYNQEHAWRLDRILDDAWAHGIRINLVINNHGQASANSDREWPNNPYHLDQGGHLAKALEFFVDPWALAGQDAVRRYIAARYADHPAVLGWKLWSEVNLTGGGAALVKWHQDAAIRWHFYDTYHHGVTTHWYGDYTSPDRAIIKLPEMDYVCLDAYHNAGKLLADLVWGSTLDPTRGLAPFHKPVLITEFGGSAGAAPIAQLTAEHLSGPWAAMVSGNGGAPMLWWIEWVDQGNLWQPYISLSRFLKDEDLRGPATKGVSFNAQSAAGKLWTRAWSCPGRMFGYVLDEEWGVAGLKDPLHEHATIEIGSDIAPGAMTLEWWDASTGVVLLSQPIAHPGGALVITAPAFKRHIAFKLWRDAT